MTLVYGFMSSLKASILIHKYTTGHNKRFIVFYAPMQYVFTFVKKGDERDFKKSLWVLFIDYLG